jgi:hypothetical protein
LNKEYQCDSLPRTAFFIACGIQPIASKRLQSGRNLWTFEWSERLEQLGEEFYEGTGAAEVLRGYMKARAKLLDEVCSVR